MRQLILGATASLALVAAATSVGAKEPDKPVAPPLPEGPPRATPIGNPGDWFPPEAYPPEARASGAQGRTGFSLEIDAAGRIMSCNIVASSGSAILDQTTCSQLIANGRFMPARDSNGKAVPGVWTSGMRWKLTVDDLATEEDDDSPPPGPPRFPPRPPGGRPAGGPPPGFPPGLPGAPRG